MTRVHCIAQEDILSDWRGMPNPMQELLGSRKRPARSSVVKMESPVSPPASQSSPKGSNGKL